MSATPTAVAGGFELTIRTESYEEPVCFGTFVSRELAEQMADAVLANWGEDNKPHREAVHIVEKPLFTELPELHVWVCEIKFDAPDEPVLYHNRKPELRASEPHWDPLQRPVRFLSVPMQFVCGSGPTPRVATARAEAFFAEAVARGALRVLERVRRIHEQAQGVLLDKAAAEGKERCLENVHWLELAHLARELALKEFGPDPIAD